MIISLDPRVTRAAIEEENTIEPLRALDQWETYEVFHQKRRGDQHMHVGIVHAPNAEMALIFGKEQFGRRGLSVNIWVVKTRDVFTTEYDDSDIFETVPDKQYREAGGYKVMDKINKFKKGLKSE
ncbi:MAG: phenylacetic acid degradation protein [Bacteroidota bacterium]|nr:phenylacetic acid degradation protein [Bacteroidota bacterium]